MSDELIEQRLRTFATALPGADWTSALLDAYNPTGSRMVSYEAAKAAFAADLITRLTAEKAGVEIDGVFIDLATLKWWRDLVDLNPADLAPRLDDRIRAASRQNASTP